MCGRYYIDDETAREIEKIVRRINDKIVQAKKDCDITPASSAPVIIGEEEALQVKELTWGFPHFKQKGVIFNARSETVFEKKMFQDSITNRRCVIPAAGFYEWNHRKEKYAFRAKERDILLLAGCYKAYPDSVRFVILTTQANESVREIHDRMPLILEPAEMEPWIFDGRRTEFILNKTPELLDKERK